jgi:hypothetical protein
MAGPDSVAEIAVRTLGVTFRAIARDSANKHGASFKEKRHSRTESSVSPSYQIGPLARPASKNCQAPEARPAA